MEPTGRGSVNTPSFPSSRLIQALICIIHLPAASAPFPVKSLKHRPIASRRGLLLAFVLAVSPSAPGLRSAIFDFSAQYQGVSASAGAGVVTMSVFDEARLMNKITNVSSGVT